MAELRDLMGPPGEGNAAPRKDDQLEALFSSKKSWANPSDPQRPEEYSAIRLYTSESGYQRMFRAINVAFRNDDFRESDSRLRAATFLVELLNIDLFNYRARNEKADNFNGRVYRGMCVSAEELSRFYDAANGPIGDRYISVPLAMMSASTEKDPAMQFAMEEASHSRDKHAMLWEIDVFNLDRDLLQFYRAQHPESIVSSLCAVPIDRLSDHPDEEEVLLRGPHFQIVRLAENVSHDPIPIHRIEAVTLNGNRDHLSAIASNEGADKRARDLFRTMILVQRSRICAEHAMAYGALGDAEDYLSVVHDNETILTSFGY